MHVRAQVAGVYPPDADGGLFRGEHMRGLLERRLRRAVAAPARVRLHRRVRGDVQHRAAALAQCREEQLNERDRRYDVRLERGSQLPGRVVGEGGQRGRAERAGVVHQQVDLPGDHGELFPVRRVGDVAGQRGDVRAGNVRPDGRRRRADCPRVAGVDDEGIAGSGEAGRQRPAKPAGSSRDYCFLHSPDARRPSRPRASAARRAGVRPMVVGPVVDASRRMPG